MKKIFTLLLLGGLLFVGAGNVFSANYLQGNWDWSYGVLFADEGTQNQTVARITLGAEETYQFEIKDTGTGGGENNKYQCPGKITSSTNFDSGWWKFTLNSGLCEIETTIAGEYVFIISWGKDGDVYYPYLKVDYPSGEGTTYSITFNDDNQSNVHAHLYATIGGHDFALTGLWPGKEVDGSGVVSIKSNVAPTKVMWNNGDPDEDKWQSSAFNFVNGATYNQYGRIYSVSFTPGTPGYATFHSEDYKVSLPSGVTANTISYNSSTRVVTVTPLTGDNSSVVPAGLPVLLTGSGSVTLSATNADANSTASSGLTGSGESGASGANGIYVLGVQGENTTGTAFYQYPSGSIPANRAYLATSDNFSGETSPSAIRIENGENNTTNLESVETTNSSVKFFKNGQLYIMRDGVVYDVLGRIAE